VTRLPGRTVSLQELRRIADTLAALRDHTVTGATMRSDRRQLRIEMADGRLLVVGVDTDDAGHPQLEVDVVRPHPEQGSQLEVRFEAASSA
jgi:hypothetical protein